MKELSETDNSDINFGTMYHYPDHAVIHPMLMPIEVNFNSSVGPVSSGDIVLT